MLDFRQKLDEYNMSLSEADSKLNTVNETEKKLRDMSERMLTGVASKFGKASDYEMADGSRKSDSQKSSRSANTAKLYIAA